MRIYNDYITIKNPVRHFLILYCELFVQLAVLFSRFNKITLKE